MRSRIVGLAAILVAATAGAAPAEIGLYEEGGMGTARTRGGLDVFEDGAFAVRGAVGYRRGALGAELMLASSELRLRRDDGSLDGVYSALTVGPMLTGRLVFAHTVMDRPFARWFELYGRVGATHTWMYGDPGEGPPDGTRGFGFAAGGGLRWVYAAIGISLDVTYVHARLHKDRVHDPRDELGVRDEPAVDLGGGIVATTLGLGFVL